MNEFLELVKERPDYSLSKIKSKGICPFCDSTDTTEYSHVSTCVAGLGGQDPNHHWSSRKCTKCEETFTVEYRKNIVWYTKNNKVLKGIPGCYESYIYTCKHCDGDVHRKLTKLDGVTETQSTMYGYNEAGKWVAHQRIFFECESCGRKVENERETFCEPARI